MAELVQAWLNCRRSKRHSASALAFEQDLERNLCELRAELLEGNWRPGQSICFVVTTPRPREVWAAPFRDRIVHHLLYGHIGPGIETSFVHSSCACIKGRGTLFAAELLESAVRSVSENWSVDAWYLKCDLANFFVSIDKHVLLAQLRRRIQEPWWLALATTVLMHDPRTDVAVRSPRNVMALVPEHKRLFNAPVDTGLPIGNLSSQFFANVLLDGLDQFAKHTLKARHYVRYVDDFCLLHRSPQALNDALARITEFLPTSLHANLNRRKTVLQPVARGIDFVGHVIRPWRRTTRPKTLTRALQRIETMPSSEIFAAGNSYLGLVRQASHSHVEQAQIARALLKRGHAIDGAMTRTFRRKSNDR